MSNSNSPSPPPSGAFSWRKRSDHLFAQSGAESHPIRRETLRRKATAALNIAESMEHERHMDENGVPARSARLTT